MHGSAASLDLITEVRARADPIRIFVAKIRSPRSRCCPIASQLRSIFVARRLSNCRGGKRPRAATLKFTLHRNLGPALTPYIRSNVKDQSHDEMPFGRLFHLDVASNYLSPSPRYDVVFWPRKVSRNYLTFNCIDILPAHCTNIVLDPLSIPCVSPRYKFCVGKRVKNIEKWDA